MRFFVFICFFLNGCIVHDYLQLQEEIDELDVFERRLADYQMNGLESLTIELPVEICVDESRRFERRIRDAVSEWEDSTDLDLFEIAENFPCKNPITYERYEEIGFNGIYEYRVNGSTSFNFYGTYGIEMYLREGEEQFFETLLHEMGHLLGLNHSPNVESLMFHYNRVDRVDRETIEKVRGKFED